MFFSPTRYQLVKHTGWGVGLLLNSSYSFVCEFGNKFQWLQSARCALVAGLGLTYFSEGNCRCPIANEFQGYLGQLRAWHSRRSCCVALGLSWDIHREIKCILISKHKQSLLLYWISICFVRFSITVGHVERNQWWIIELGFGSEMGKLLCLPPK